MQPVIRVWKLEGEETKLGEKSSARPAEVPSWHSDTVCGCVCVIPLSKDGAEVVQDSAELHLQLIEDVGCFCIQLQHTYMNKRKW